MSALSQLDEEESVETGDWDFDGASPYGGYLLMG